jgi:hypothetical protein
MKMIMKANVNAQNVPFGGSRCCSDSFTIGTVCSSSSYSVIYSTNNDRIKSSGWNLGWVRSYDR